MTRAIIPIAGNGTRMFPMSSILPKPLFPVVDGDAVKPALLVQVEGLLRSGITEIGLIARPKDIPLLEQLFSGTASLRKTREHLTWIIQDRAAGFGHAVWCAGEFCRNGPVLLTLGDRLYRAYGPESAARQMIRAFEDTQSLAIGIEAIPLEQAPVNGIMTGQFGADGLMRIQRIREKPSVSQAKAECLSEAPDGGRKLYGVFGLYVLTKNVFDILNEKVARHTGENEIGLTEVLSEVPGAVGVPINGRSFDIGLPANYREAVSMY